MGRFAVDIRAFAEKAKANADAVVREVVLDIGTSLVMKSPVGNPSLWKSRPPKGYVGGRFRANWQIGINVAISGVLPNIDPTGQVSIARIGAAVPQNAAGEIYVITNNLPYAQRLEYGHSTQAPNGMVALTMIEWSVIVDNAANGVRAGTSIADFNQGYQTYKL